MRNIYFKPYSNRKAEKFFFSFLQNKYKDVNHISEEYKLSKEYINSLIDTNKLSISVDKCPYIKEKKKEIIKEHLLKLPKKIKVARNISDLSIDFVIEDNSHLTFIEFHEKQHYRLSNDRLKPIFSHTNERYEVPRFLQRLIKDVWRWKNLTNYKIVWQNWFEKNCDSVIDFDEEKNEEFALPEKFLISSL